MEKKGTKINGKNLLDFKNTYLRVIERNVNKGFVHKGFMEKEGFLEKEGFQQREVASWNNANGAGGTMQGSKRSSISLVEPHKTS